MTFLSLFFSLPFWEQLVIILTGWLILWMVVRVIFAPIIDRLDKIIILLQKK